MVLKYTNGYEEDLTKEFQRIAYDPFYKYYWGSGAHPAQPYKADEQNNCISMVSVDKHSGDLLGLLTYTVDEWIRAVTSIGAISFSKKPNVIFSRDIYKFLADIFVLRKLNKINWWVTVGNPIEKSYDKLAKRYGGRIVGTFDADVLTYDGQLLPKKYYEITRESFEKTLDSHKKPMVH